MSCLFSRTKGLFNNMPQPTGVQSAIANYKAASPASVQSPATSNNWYSQLKQGGFRTTPKANQATQPSGLGTLAKNVIGGAVNPIGEGLSYAEQEVPKLVQGAKDVASNVNNRINQTGAIEGSSESTPAKVLDIAGQGAGAINDTVGSAIKAVIPTSLLNLIGKEAQPVVQSAIQSPAGQSILKWWNGLSPETQQHLGATGQIVSLFSNAVGAGEAKPALNAVADAAKPVVEGAAKVAGDATKGAANAAKSKIVGSSEKQIASTAKDWAKPTTISKPAFNNAKAVIANSPTTPEFLAKQGLNPAAHVDETGRFDTAGSAQALRDTANKMSSETLRPSLQMADYSTPKTPVKEVIANASKGVSGDKSLTEGERDNVIRNLNKEANALNRKYPDGMSLTDMHDSKITYAKNGGYSPIKSAADNSLATSNRNIASALQKSVETKAPDSVPVKAFNQYLSQYHKGADYLDALNTKLAPVGFAKNIARIGARATGAVIGSHLGGLPAEFAGYQVGKALEHAVENLTKPGRATFLNNLEKTNPAAFDKVQNFLRDKNAGEPGIKKLGPGKAIQLPASEEAQMKGRALQLQSETPRDLSHAQESTPATKSNTSAIGDKPTPATKNIKRPLNSGFVKIPGGKVPQDDLRTMSDFTDYVAGSYRPKGQAAADLEQEAADLYDKHIGGKAPVTLKGLANKFGRLLENNNFGKEQPRGDDGRYK